MENVWRQWCALFVVFSIVACGDSPGDEPIDASVAPIDASADPYEDYEPPPIAQDAPNSPALLQATMTFWPGETGLDVLVYYNQGNIAGLSTCAIRLYTSLDDTEQSISDIDSPFIEGPDRACKFQFGTSDFGAIDDLVAEIQTQTHWPALITLTNTQDGVTLSAKTRVEVVQ